jgi:hypothetical protein
MEGNIKQDVYYCMEKKEKKEAKKIDVFMVEIH